MIIDSCLGCLRYLQRVSRNPHLHWLRTLFNLSVHISSTTHLKSSLWDHLITITFYFFSDILPVDIGFFVVYLVMTLLSIVCAGGFTFINFQQNWKLNVCFWMLCWSFSVIYISFSFSTFWRVSGQAVETVESYICN